MASPQARSATPSQHDLSRGASVGYATLTCLSLLLLGTQAALGEAPTLSREYQIKAAFLYNFTNFIQWPEGSFDDDGSPIVIGWVCPDQFGAELEKVVKDRTVQGRPMVVKRIVSGNQARSTHLLFVCSSDDTVFAALTADGTPNSVVTVGESKRFADRGGIITFVLRDDKVRFEINMDTADRHRLKISSHLQNLATVVRRGP